MLGEFFDFCFVIAQRFAGYLLQTQGNKYEVKSFLERYSAWMPTEYDMFQRKHHEAVERMVAKFEEEALAIESRFMQSQHEKESSDNGKCLNRNTVDRGRKGPIGKLPPLARAEPL